MGTGGFFNVFNLYSRGTVKECFLEPNVYILTESCAARADFKTPEKSEIHSTSNFLG